MDILLRELTYLWYYFSVQLQQIAGYWILGMVLGSAISVFGKEKIHGMFAALREKKLGVLGVIPASLLGIASPLCMYGTIPIAASFAEQGMEEDWIAAFMITGPATKITNLGAVKIVLGMKNFAIYLLFTVLFALLSGLAVDYVFNITIRSVW
jgi:uncharacterized membrane protein YraQ (UPF0718 family)